MMNQNNNKLLMNYNQNIQNMNNTFRQNELLQNNPMFMNGVNQNTVQQMQIMQQKIKEIQQIKQIEKINEIETTLDKEKIKESVIRPIHIERDKNNKQKLERDWKEAETKYLDKNKKEFGSEIKDYWKKRTNEPYKNILKNENYKKDYKDPKELIVHRISKEDKDERKAEENFKSYETTREKHNDELKVIYSTSNKNEHKKDFEYKHVYKYRIPHDSKDHDKLKQDKIKFYKEQQKKEEAGKEQLNSLQKLIDDGIFDKDELSEFSITKEVKINNNDDSNSDNNKSKKDAYLERKRKQ
ncbi:hypothetical protein Klosneuvirus_1_210 [Klosneuvirus KNV1]|uniref:Uncharacterized protein n=1 Tax=Klosneuvirus KNV1 TaxID=1977640 RepID=A0A1V0SI05_9VIRU|nr:hypothetical protein Klosneuvirus_1_210 [Klosneuvirus KNV1]